MSTFTIWWLAIRPKTLWISFTPVLVGSALAWQSQQYISMLTTLAILSCTLCIQIATNLYNDAADFEKGADTYERLGPKRAAQQGWLTAKQIKSAAYSYFILAFFIGIYLVFLGGVIIIAIGLISIFAGYAYTGGPKPIAYSPFGELFVMIFFGVIAVTGTYYLHTQTLQWQVFYYAIAIGSMASAILLVNNYRDLDSDIKAQKFTLVHTIGRPKTRILFVALLIIPYIQIIIMSIFYSFWLLLPLISLPLALKRIQLFLSLNISSQLNTILAQTAQLQLIYSILLAMAFILSS